MVCGAFGFLGSRVRGPRLSGTPSAFNNPRPHRAKPVPPTMSWTSPVRAQNLIDSIKANLASTIDNSLSADVAWD